jgi:hypothetical protein
MAAEEIADAARREQEYKVALQDVRAAEEIEKQSPDGPSVNESALTAARIDLGQGAYDRALERIAFAGRFRGHEDTVALLRALAYRCLKRADSVAAMETYTRLPGVAEKPQYSLDLEYFERVANRCASQ